MSTWSPIMLLGLLDCNYEFGMTENRMSIAFNKIANHLYHEWALPFSCIEIWEATARSTTARSVRPRGARGRQAIMNNYRALLAEAHHGRALVPPLPLAMAADPPPSTAPPAPLLPPLPLPPGRPRSPRRRQRWQSERAGSLPLPLLRASSAPPLPSPPPLTTSR